MRGGAAPGSISATQSARPATGDETLKGGPSRPTSRVLNPDVGLRRQWWRLWRGDWLGLRPRRPHVPLHLVSLTRPWLLAAALFWTGCPDPVGNKVTAGPEALSVPAADDRSGSIGDRRETRFIKIRDLLRKGSDDPERAKQLYPLVHPICVEDAARKDFLDVARWSASFSDDDNKRTIVLVVDTLEYVATACFGTDAEGTLALLNGAQAFLPNESRLEILRARLLAAGGDLDAALKSAETAAQAGSVHAVALKANIQARMARSADVGYRAGMLDAAISTVSIEPAAHWRAIDLAAILSTKARLLWERAAWEDGDRARRTLLEADGLFQRLSVPPFLVETRLRALDNLCYDAVIRRSPADELAPCRRAAEKFQVLGAGAVTGMAPDPARFDEPRRARIIAARQTWTALPQRAVVAWIARGDEAELLEWTRPTARMVKALNRPDLRWVVIDRAREPRASTLIDRMVVLAGVKPTAVLRVGKQPLAMPCITAVLAQRRTPAACPLAGEMVETLEGLKPYGTALLVGRDLDAELDDLALYKLDATLLSFRLSQLEKPVHAWLKSVSDTFLMAP